MKTTIILLLFALGSVCLTNCHPPNGTKQANISPENADTCFKGKLVVSGLCKQRVIEVLSENTGNLSLNAAWTNPEDGKVYRNAFNVRNVCDFPGKVKTGDTISFKIIAAQKKECSVCLAYIPVPDSSNIIEVGCE